MKNSFLSNIKCFILTLFIVVNGQLLSQSALPWYQNPNNPVLQPGLAGAWDDTSAGVSCVLYQNNLYHLWYEGNMDKGIGYATSTDGVIWSKDSANPVLVHGADTLWDGLSVHNASVVYTDGIFKMWYSGIDADHDSRIGLATSPDGIFWTKDTTNPVLDLGQPGDWDSNEAMHPWVLYENGMYKMYYNGHDGSEQRILHAVSPDGIIWTKFTIHPMLEPGAAGQWDENKLGPMTVVIHDTTYHMWYMAWNFNYEFGIGHAYSSDGIMWTKDTLNPVITSGASGTWNDTYVAVPSVIWNDSIRYMWYGGSDGIFGSTGLATGEPPPNGVINNSPIIPPTLILKGNYPNPFNPETTISYSLSLKNYVTLKIYNILGKVLITLINEDQPVNDYHVKWNAVNYPSGLYYYVLLAGKEKKVGKMLLLK